MKKLASVFLLLLFVATTKSVACSCVNYFEGVSSLTELEPYSFIALIKVTAEREHDKDPSHGVVSVGALHFKTLEQFKGEPKDQLLEYDVNSSCDLGIEVGDEWVLFAKEIEGKLAITACDRNVRYRDHQGVRDWHFNRGVRELNDLRKLHQRAVQPIPDGTHRLLYPNGRIELEVSYLNGTKQGLQTVYFPNGGVWGTQYYDKDSLEGESRWHYPSGQLGFHNFYHNNKKVNTSRMYYDTAVSPRYKQLLLRDFYKTEDSLYAEHHRIQVWMETVYDHQGNAVISKDYDRRGRLTSERLYHHNPNFHTYISYHDTGVVSSIGYSLEYKSYGHYQEYDRNGNPTKSWDYDEQGRQIKSSMKGYRKP